MKTPAFAPRSHSVSENVETLITHLDRLEAPPQPGNGVRAYPSEPPAFSVLQIAELLWRERRFILRCSLCALVTFALIALLLPNHYTATTRLMPPDYSAGSNLALSLPALSDSSSGGAGIMGMASRLLGINTSGDLLIGVLQSENVEDRVIKKLDLMHVYSDKYIEDARKHLETRTSLNTDPKNGIISISVSDKSAARAAQIANEYVAELNQALAEVNTSSAHRERLFLEQRLEQVRQQSEADSKEFALFASQNGAVDIPDQAKSMVAAGAGLQSQLIVAQAELKGLEQIYSQNNARVRSARARVDELQSQMNKFGGKNVNPSTDTALGQDQLYPSVRQLPLLGVKYLDLYRRSKVDDAVFELLTKEYEIAKIQEAKEIPTAQVLDPALVPGKKSWPHRLIISLGGMLAALVCSCAYLVGCLAWDCTEDTNSRKRFLSEVFSSFNVQSRVPGIGAAVSRLTLTLGLRRNGDAAKT
jgi:uncharacterized protein involved in exopolysaccharide biosynthesis